VKFDFASEEEAKAGETAARAGVQAARVALAATIQDSERELRDGPRTFAFINQPAPKKPEGPKPLPRDIDQFSNDAFNLLQLGLYRAVDEQLKDLPVERIGTSVRLHASAPVNAASLVFAISAITALGSNANATFTEVSNTIEVSPKTIADPPEIRKKPIDKKTSEAPVLPSGTRAVALHLSTESVAAGLGALPSSRVDVFLRTKDDRNQRAVLVCENAMVVAADIPDKDDKTAVITLAVPPADATKVAEAQERGSLFLVLRQPVEKKK
jgi:hypothetical protein